MEKNRENDENQNTEIPCEGCIDILVQVAAVNAALNSFSRVLLSDHIKTCVTQDILDGKEETVDELVETVKKLMK